MEKNEQHGPCKLTGNAVFGSNHFKDLTHEEFKAKYLTGYTGPKTDELNDRHNKRKLRTSDKVNEMKKREYPTHENKAKPNDMLSSNGLHDPSDVKSHHISRHESVQERYLKHIENTPALSKTYYNYEEKQKEKACKCGTSYNSGGSSSSSSSSKSYYSSRGLGLFQRKSPLFGKTYYNSYEKQKLCGYTKTYYNSGSSSSSSSSLDCSAYRLEADTDYDQLSNHRTSSGSCSNWYDLSCWMQNFFSPIFLGSYKESLYSNYNYPSCKYDTSCIVIVTLYHRDSILYFVVMLVIKSNNIPNPDSTFYIILQKKQLLIGESWEQ